MSRSVWILKEKERTEQRRRRRRRWLEKKKNGIGDDIKEGEKHANKNKFCNMQQDECAANHCAPIDISATLVKNETVTLDDDPLIQPLIDTSEFAAPTNTNGEFYPTKCHAAFETSPAAVETSCTQLFRKCRGIGCALLSSIIFTSSTFTIKQLEVDLFDTLLFRFLVQTSILVAFIHYKRYKILDGSAKLIAIQIFRAMLGAMGLLLLYASYRCIPLPDLTTVRYTQVIWTAIFAMFIFHERISVFTVIAIVLTLLGVVYVAQPTFIFGHSAVVFNQTRELTSRSDKSSRTLGFSLALGCAISISWSIVLNKKLLVLKVPQSVLVYHFAVLNLGLLIVYHIYNRFILCTYADQTMFTGRYILAASISLSQVFSSTIIQTAFKLEHPSVISIVQSSDILFAVLLQNIFTNEKSNALVLIGAALVTTSIFLVGIHKVWKEREKSSKENPPAKVWPSPSMIAQEKTH